MRQKERESVLPLFWREGTRRPLSLSLSFIKENREKERERERERERAKRTHQPKNDAKKCKKKEERRKKKRETRKKKKRETREKKKVHIDEKTAQQKALSRPPRDTDERKKKKSIMRDDSDPGDDEDEDDAEDADVLEEAPSTSHALEEEEEDDATINLAGLHNVSNTCYLNATVQVMCICVFFLSSNFDIDSRDVFGPNAMFASVALLLAFVRLRSSSDHRTTTTNVL